MPDLDTIVKKDRPIHEGFATGLMQAVFVPSYLVARVFRTKNHIGATLRDATQESLCKYGDTDGVKYGISEIAGYCTGLVVGVATGFTLPLSFSMVDGALYCFSDLQEKRNKKRTLQKALEERAISYSENNMHK